MRNILEALAELEGLPQLTREVEDAVHLHGILPSTIARALGLPETEIRAHLQAARVARSLVLEAGCVDENKVAAPAPPNRAIEPVRELEIEEKLVRRAEAVRKQGPKPPPRPRLEPPRPAPKAPQQTKAPRRFVGQVKLERALALAREGALIADIAQAVGWTPVTVSCQFSIARRRGVDIPKQKPGRTPGQVPAPVALPTRQLKVPAPVAPPTRPRWTEATLQKARLKQQARLARQVTEPTGMFSAAALFGIQPASTGVPPEQDRKQP